MSVRKTLCKLDEIPDAGALAVDTQASDGALPLILLRQGQNVFAYYNECPHAGRRLEWAPGRFLIENGQLICAAHGASFYIESGRCAGGPCGRSALVSVPVELIDGCVTILL